MGDEMGVLWRLVGTGADMWCRVVGHPEGFELRVEQDRAVVRSVVCTTYAELFERSREWSVSWQALGWRMADPRP